MRRLLTILLILSVASISNANLISNGGFDGSTGMYTADGWDTVWNAGVWADTGQNALKAWGDGAQWGNGGANQLGFAMYAGTTVSLSVDILDPSAEPMTGAEAHLALTFKDSGGNALNGTWGTAYVNVGSGTLTPDTWTNFSFSAVAPAGTVSVDLQLEFQGTSAGGGGGAVWFDNVGIIPEPMTVALLGLGGLLLRRRK